MMSQSTWLSVAWNASAKVITWASSAPDAHMSAQPPAATGSSTRPAIVVRKMASSVHAWGGRRGGGLSGRGRRSAAQGARGGGLRKAAIGSSHKHTNVAAFQKHTRATTSGRMRQRMRQPTRQPTWQPMQQPMRQRMRQRMCSGGHSRQGLGPQAPALPAAAPHPGRGRSPSCAGWRPEGRKHALQCAPCGAHPRAVTARLGSAHRTFHTHGCCPCGGVAPAAGGGAPLLAAGCCFGTPAAGARSLPAAAVGDAPLPLPLRPARSPCGSLPA